jgi:hypothetical protein
MVQRSGESGHTLSDNCSALTASIGGNSAKSTPGKLEMRMAAASNLANSSAVIIMSVSSNKLVFIGLKHDATFPAPLQRGSG